VKIGRLIAYLEESGQLENTLIFYGVDNGASGEGSPSGSDNEIRHQYHHCTDIVPTILECCGITMPESIDGQKQSPLAGVSMRYSFDNAKAPTTKETQYYEMVGTRGIWHKGWKASTVHAPAPADQGSRFGGGTVLLLAAPDSGTVEAWRRSHSRVCSARAAAARSSRSCRAGHSTM
jgi:arylsulfatase A-like enzyme